MKSILFSLLLALSLSLIFFGCTAEQSDEPVIVDEESVESPAKGSDTMPAEGSAAEDTPAGEAEGSGTTDDEQSTAAKTGEAVGGAVKTVGDAAVEGAQKVGEATKDAVEGAVEGVKGDKKN